MPVRKFRSFEEASRALVEEGNREGLEVRIARLWAFSASLAPPLDFRGVRKYRSIEEANADRLRRTIARPRRG